jgi:hypothetical protein
MTQLRHRKSILLSVLIGLMLVMAAPGVALGQGRGRGRGPDLGKKCSKFVNCHDARDGRWDGRGPNRNRWALQRRERRNRQFRHHDDSSRRRRVIRKRDRRFRR